MEAAEKAGNVADKDYLCSLIGTQLSLAAQIVRESRALSGEGSYAFPPHAFDD